MHETYSVTIESDTSQRDGDSMPEAGGEARTDMLGRPDCDGVHSEGSNCRADDTTGDADARSDTDDLTTLVKACDTDLGDPSLWFTPDGYPDSLALCIIDSIYSTGARYSSVVNVVGRYRAYRTSQGGDPDTDGTDELAATFTELGGQWVQHRRLIARTLRS